MGLGTSNGQRSMGIDSQHRGLELREIAGPKSKDLGLSRLGSERYWPGSFWRWVDLLG